MNSLFIPCSYLLHNWSIFFVARRTRLTSYSHFYANKTLLRTDRTTHISSDNICARYGALVRSEIRFNRPISILCVGPTMRWWGKIPPTYRGWSDGDIVHFMQRYAQHSFWYVMAFRWICGMLHVTGCKRHSNTRTAMVGGRRLFFWWFLTQKNVDPLPFLHCNRRNSRASLSVDYTDGKSCFLAFHNCTERLLNVSCCCFINYVGS